MITEERKRELREAISNVLMKHFETTWQEVVDEIIHATEQEPEPAAVVPEREGQEELWNDWWKELWKDPHAAVTKFIITRREAPEKPVAPEGEVYPDLDKFADLERNIGRESPQGEHVQPTPQKEKTEYYDKDGPISKERWSEMNGGDDYKVTE